MLLNRVVKRPIILVNDPDDPNYCGHEACEAIATVAVKAQRWEGSHFPDDARCDAHANDPRETPVIYKIPEIWQRTSRYHESIRGHVLTHKGREGMLERFGDGGYPLYYQVTGEWCRGNRVEEYVCPECASNVHDTGNWPDDAQVTGVDVNWEDPDFYCDCGERIPSAYAECDDCDNGNTSTPGEYYEACDEPKCEAPHLATCVTCRGHGGKLTDECLEEHKAWIAQGQAFLRRCYPGDPAILNSDDEATT